MTIHALAPLFRGPLEPFADALTLAPAAGARPASDLLNAEALRERIERLARAYGDCDRRAVASIWSKHHFSTLVPTALAANLMLGLDLPVALESVGVVADEQGRTRQIVLPDAGKPFFAAEEDRFDALVDRHLTPLIETLAKVAGCSPKVFWSNAGNVFEYVVSRAGDLGADPSAVGVGVTLMAERRRRGRGNPLFAPISYPPDGQRLRRVCCLRYFAPGVGYCGTCPIAPRDPRRRRVK